MLSNPSLQVNSRAAAMPSFMLALPLLLLVPILIFPPFANSHALSLAFLSIFRGCTSSFDFSDDSALLCSASDCC